MTLQDSFDLRDGSGGHFIRHTRGSGIFNIKVDAVITQSVAELFSTIAHEKRMPNVIKLDVDGNLHSDDGPAVVWLGNEKDYYIHGVRVPTKVVMNPHSITKEDLRDSRNIEVRRILIEKIGVDKFMNLLDLEVLDIKVINTQEYTLLKTRRKDPAIQDYLIYLRVIDTSTGALHHIPVPPDMLDAHEAVAWTFRRKKNEYKPDLEA